MTNKELIPTETKQMVIAFFNFMIIAFTLGVHFIIMETVRWSEVGMSIAMGALFILNFNFFIRVGRK